MFEYTTADGYHITFNPNHIVSITDYGCNDGQCRITTSEGTYVVNASYNAVTKQFYSYSYGIQRIISV